METQRPIPYASRMRTTVPLDPGVHALIRAAMKERGISFKEAVKAAIKAGLNGPSGRGFVQKTFLLGEARNFAWDKALPEASAIGDEAPVQRMRRE